MRRELVHARRWRSLHWATIWTWILTFSLIAYLGLNGGGFDPLVHDQVGIAAWWIVLVTVLVGALPRRSPDLLTWTALGLLAALSAWTVASLGWTESPDKTWGSIAYIATYLGVFVLAVFSRSPGGAREVVAAVAVAISLISTIALLSRLHPAWFPEIDQATRALSGGEERLSFPLNYWNALAGLVAIGLPLLLQLANGAGSILLRALAAAGMPAMALTAFFTLSRGGIAAAVIALTVFLAFSPDRLPKLLTLLAAGFGGAILISAATQRDALQAGLLNQTALDQGNEILIMTLACCAAVGLLQAAISLALRRGKVPRLAHTPRRQALPLALFAVLALLTAAAIDIPGRASSAWGEFKQGGGAGEGAGRLASAAGQSRYQYWSVAVAEFRTEPLTGTGAGTFEYSWMRRREDEGAVRDAHSVYLQTLSELGAVGVGLLAAFVLTILLGGGVTVVRASRHDRPPLAAALAGCTAFWLTAAYDWTWQLPVLPVAMLLLASALLTTGGANRGATLRFLPRLGIGLAAGGAIVAIAIPLASTSLTRQSQAAVREGDLDAALHAARSAQNAQPTVAAPRLQQALVLELLGKLTPAAAAAQAATEREAVNWRNWLVLSRVEARRGKAASAVRNYRRAVFLNPDSPLFDR